MTSGALARLGHGPVQWWERKGKGRLNPAERIISFFVCSSPTRVPLSLVPLGGASGNVWKEGACVADADETKRSSAPSMCLARKLQERATLLILAASLIVTKVNCLPLPGILLDGIAGRRRTALQ